MKRIWLICTILLIFVFAGCGQSETAVPSAETTAQAEVLLYLPNDQADGFIRESVSCREDPQAIVDALAAAGALSTGTTVQHFELVSEENQIHLDISNEFATALSSTGTAGEYMLLGSLVNTLLTHYGADTLLLTSDGSVVETGHNVYDFPIGFLN